MKLKVYIKQVIDFAWKNMMTSLFVAEEPRKLGPSLRQNTRTSYFPVPSYNLWIHAYLFHKKKKKKDIVHKRFRIIFSEVYCHLKYVVFKMSQCLYSLKFSFFNFIKHSFEYFYKVTYVYWEDVLFVCFESHEQFFSYLAGTEFQTNTIPISMHQMCNRTNTFSSVILRLKKLEVRKKC
jgi:hypothetical protein